MKKRMRLVIIALVLVVAITAVVLNAKKPKQIKYLTTKATVGTLSQTVDATGSIASAEDIDLNFKSSGKISAINIAVGARVLNGQVLATLASQSVRADVLRNQAAVSAAEADLERLLAGSTSEQVAITQQEVVNATTQLDSAKATLANLTITQSRTRDQYSSSALQNLIDKEFVASYTLQVIFDAIFDADAQSGFKTTKTADLQSARSSYDAAINLLKSSDVLMQSAKKNPSQSNIVQALRTLRESLDEISSCVEHSLTALSGAVPNASYTANIIEGFKSSLNTQASAIATAKTTTQLSINNFTTDEQSLLQAADAASFAVRTAEGNMQLVQAKLKLATAKPQSYDIKQQQARVAQAQANLDVALSTLADLSIVAPLDGTVTAVNYKLGEQTSIANPVITMIGDSKLEIDVDIPESDISKIALTNDVTITLDAFSSDTEFKGTVTFIEPAQRVIQGVVYYRVKVSLNQNDARIKPGMTANLTILTARKENVASLPIRAIATNADGVKSVRVLGSLNTPETKIVTTGLRGDGGMIEILSGITEGDMVITGESK